MSAYRFCSSAELITASDLSLVWTSCSSCWNLPCKRATYYSFPRRSLLFWRGLVWTMNWQRGYLLLLRGKMGQEQMAVSSYSSCTANSAASAITASMSNFFSFLSTNAISSTELKEQSLSSILPRITATMQRQSSGVKGCAARQSKTQRVCCLLRMSVSETSRRGCTMALRGQSSAFTLCSSFLSRLPRKPMMRLDELGQSQKMGLSQLSRKVREISNAAIASSLKRVTKGQSMPGSHWTLRSGYNLVREATMKATCLSRVCSGKSGQGLVSSVKCWWLRGSCSSCAQMALRVLSGKTLNFLRKVWCLPRAALQFVRDCQLIQIIRILDGLTILHRDKDRHHQYRLPSYLSP